MADEIHRYGSAQETLRGEDDPLLTGLARSNFNRALSDLNQAIRLDPKTAAMNDGSRIPRPILRAVRLE